jgi:thiol-disulfide isomerase/thioredoxin
MMGPSAGVSRSLQDKRIRDVLGRTPPYKTGPPSERFQAEFKKVLEALLSRERYVVLFSAEWCKPCQHLKHRLKETGRLAEIDAIVMINRLPETHFVKVTLARNGIADPPVIPSIFVKARGRVTSYYSAEVDDAGTFFLVDWDQSKIPFDERMRR